MANNLYNTLGGNINANDGGFGAMMQQFKQFSNSFTGDARTEVQRLLQSGQISQDRFNQLGQLANRMIHLK